MGYVLPPNPSSKEKHAYFEGIENDRKLNMSESRAHFERLRAANREQIAINQAQRKKADKGVPDRKEERKYPQESKEVADREKGIEAQKKIKVEFDEFDAFFGPNPRMGANQRALEESMASFRSNQKELNESIPQFEKGDTSVSMASFEDNQKELNKIIPKVENRLAGADAAAREQQLLRDQQAGIGAGAPRRSGRAHGLQPQLPMSIFARQMHPNVTGRTKERRESMEQKRQEMSMSEVDIRDPAGNDNLFDNQSLSMRDPTDLQNSPRPIRGWDPDVSSISAGSPYGGSRTIASAQSLEDTISEIENQ
jgi:exonuclease VII small subunit